MKNFEYAQPRSEIEASRSIEVRSIALATHVARDFLPAPARGLGAAALPISHGAGARLSLGTGFQRFSSGISHPPKNPVGLSQ